MEIAITIVLVALIFGLIIWVEGISFAPGAKSTGIVIVGMGQSAKYGKCEGAVHDAETMNGILKKYGKPTVLLNNQATKAAVINALNAAKQKDLLIFFYSGHGGSDPIGDVSGEPDRKNEYLCLYNTYLLDNEIWNIISSAKNRVLLVFDCCHSETMFRSAGMNLGNLLARDAEARSSKDKVRMICWSGCADNTYSYGDSNGGMLTNAIKKAYKKGRTYNKVWNLAKARMPSYQIAKKTELGKSFSKQRVFR